MSVECWIVVYCDHDRCPNESGGMVHPEVTMPVNVWVENVRTAAEMYEKRPWIRVGDKDYCNEHRHLYA